MSLKLLRNYCLVFIKFISKLNKNTITEITKYKIPILEYLQNSKTVFILLNKLLNQFNSIDK